MLRIELRYRQVRTEWRPRWGHSVGHVTERVKVNVITARRSSWGQRVGQGEDRAEDKLRPEIRTRWWQSGEKKGQTERWKDRIKAKVRRHWRSRCGQSRGGKRRWGKSGSQGEYRVKVKVRIERNSSEDRGKVKVRSKWKIRWGQGEVRGVAEQRTRRGQSGGYGETKWKTLWGQSGGPVEARAESNKWGQRRTDRRASGKIAIVRGMAGEKSVN